jgi:transposase
MKFDVGRFNFRKLNKLEVRKQYQAEILNRFTALENLNYSQDIIRAWENIKENVISSAKGSLCLYELKQHIPWFDEECLQFLDKRKRVNM